MTGMIDSLPVALHQIATLTPFARGSELVQTVGLLIGVILGIPRHEPVSGKHGKGASRAAETPRPYSQGFHPQQSRIISVLPLSFQGFTCFAIATQGRCLTVSKTPERHIVERGEKNLARSVHVIYLSASSRSSRMGFLTGSQVRVRSLPLAAVTSKVEECM
jgi:hypothetical protein